MKKRIPFIFIVFCIGLISCDYYYKYEYIVENKSDTKITVELYTKNKPAVDTLYSIPSGQSLQIYETLHGNEGARGPFFADVKNDLTGITIKKNDSLISKRNYRKNENWEFLKGTYSTTVTNSEFD